MTGSKLHIIYKPFQEDDPTERKPLIDLTKEKSGGTPKIKLGYGVKK
jgi:hypothetical protein